MSERDIIETAQDSEITKWHTVRFDEIATHLREVVNPSEFKNKRFVGLAHLDSGLLKIRRWGSRSDLQGDKLRFYQSDIIFAKRNAYLRRLAVADFDGICSAHAMVLRANKNNIFPDFLPFFMESDQFFKRALSISVGSLSPTMNWSDLAAEEFNIPSIRDQRKFTRVLTSTENLLDKNVRVLEKTKQLKKSLMQQLLTKGIGHTKFKRVKISRKNYEEIPEEWETKNLDKLSSVHTGGTPSTSEASYWNGGNIPWINSGEVHNCRINTHSELITQKGLDSSSAKILPASTVLVALTGATTGNIGLLEFECSTNQSLTGILPSDKINSIFLFYNLIFQRRIIRLYSVGTAQPHINQQIVKNVIITLPPLPEQKAIASILSDVDKTIDAHTDFLEKTKQLKKELIEKLLTPPSDSGDGA